MWVTVQRIAGIAGLASLFLAFVAGLAGAGNLGWFLLAAASFLLALSVFTGSRGLLRE